MRKRKEHLIPPGKSRKVIYLERRGREKRMTMAGTVVFGLLGALCLSYCLIIGLFVNHGTKFFLIWGVLGVLFGLAALLCRKGSLLETLPVWLRRTAGIFLMAGLLLFVVVEGLILTQFSAEAMPSADYLIVLGAQWKEKGPGYLLEKRLEKAVEYLKENPDTRVIVSGGQGSDEPISEAEGMAGYLEAAGISPDRVIQEDKSVNTYENISLSGKLLNREKDRVAVVTNNFHVFRAVQIAKKQGYRQVEGLAAKSHLPTLPNNMLREFFGIVKDFAVGNL